MKRTIILILVTILATASVCYCLFPYFLKDNSQTNSNLLTENVTSFQEIKDDKEPKILEDDQNYEIVIDENGDEVMVFGPSEDEYFVQYSNESIIDKENGVASVYYHGTKMDNVQIKAAYYLGDYEVLLGETDFLESGEEINFIEIDKSKIDEKYTEGVLLVDFYNKETKETGHINNALILNIIYQ